MKNSEKSDAAVERAYRVMAQSGIVETLKRYGCKVNVIGSVAMGLIASHKDIDLHVYSKGVTTTGSFAVMAEIADNPAVTEIICINGLHTDERCIAWHINYRCSDGEMWKFDIIHIEEGSRYDGFFEKMAERIKGRLTPELRELILELKFSTPDDMKISGVEYYEAVIADGVGTLPALYEWVEQHRANPRSEYWIPEE